MSRPRLFIVAGTPGSGKDEIIRAVRDLGVSHATIVPKHTNRARQVDDGQEMICPGEKGFNLESCQVKYGNFKKQYGIRTDTIWKNLRLGITQVLVVSNIQAIQRLLDIFGDCVRLIYVHSTVTPEDFARQAEELHYNSDYTNPRIAEYWDAFDDYVHNIQWFDHVLIHAAENEDLYDQVFRLFRAYEQGELREQ